jgi:hypothetical protein
MSVENGHWVPGIGDPSVMGWVTVIVYFIVAIICLKAAVSEKPEKLFWLFLTFTLIALGINKQLDLQSLLIQFGRGIAIEQGWYKDRRLIQVVFIILLGLLGISALTVLIKTYHHACFTVKIALTGCAILFSFILIRASSFNHLDIFINMKLASAIINGLLELGGLIVIGTGGYRYITRNKVR